MVNGSVVLEVEGSSRISHKFVRKYATVPLETSIFHTASEISVAPLKFSPICNWEI